MEDSFQKVQTAADFQKLRRFLNANHLPAEDVSPEAGVFLALLSPEGEVLACGGIEWHVPYGLLRSIAVSDKWRNRKVGSSLVAALLKKANDQRLRELYLLTETAAAWFEKRNFIRTDRSTVPPSIGNTFEFAHACPATAICMKRIL